MTRLYGRCSKKTRLHAAAPCGRWRTTTMISSVRLDGSTACMTIEGATNSEIFYQYIKEILLPTLSPGDIVIMDNLSAHKNVRTLELMEAKGIQVRFLPAYSPDFNPIELMWSKVKTLLRKAEARTPEALLEAIGNVLSMGGALALKTMASYIELNPVRAKICEDPKDYRWSSYADAVAGEVWAEKALRWLNSLTSSSQNEGDIQQRERLVALPREEVLRCWRCYLFGISEALARYEE